MFQLKRVVNSIFSSNTYVITHVINKYAYLVDCGNIETFSEITNDYIIKGVFITHSHFDHIYGLNKLIEHFPDCTIYISENGREGLFDDKRNFSLYHEEPLNFKGGNIHVVQNGECIDLFDDIKMECFYTPTILVA